VLDFTLNSGPGKNEPKRLGFVRESVSGIVVSAFSLRELDECHGFFFRLGDGGLALGLQGAELGGVLFHRTADAIFIGCQDYRQERIMERNAGVSASACRRHWARRGNHPRLPSHYFGGRGA
jgi:hypothetical protein